jgi:hypothetical protein
MFALCSPEADMMMARRFESGFSLVERCRRELPTLAGFFPQDAAMHAALNELVAAAARVDNLLCHANQPNMEVDAQSLAERAGGDA